ncbi:MAG: SDR family oxidoreductase [Gammaproteobacteria bacterium]|nr:SDR family oxidoreductase [Gammaproteobacteria bacterium]
MSNVLIISGSSDIGSAVAKKLVETDNNVHLTGRNEETIAPIANELNVTYSVLDASHFNDVNSTFELAQEKLGAIDAVINCAGSLLLKSAHLTTESQYHEVIQANLTTAFAVVHSAGKYMSQKGGSVVLVSSAAALVGLPNHEAIAAAKAGIIGLARSAAATYANNNLRFNVVAPGLVESKLTVALTQSPVGRKASESMHPLGRLGTPEDVASAILFFIAPENSWVTGQVLSVDGGLSYIRPRVKA